jgi:hypothetical protein
VFHCYDFLSYSETCHKSSVRYEVQILTLCYGSVLVCWTYQCLTSSDVWVCGKVGIILEENTEVLNEKLAPLLICPWKLTWKGLILNQGLHSEKPTYNCVSCDRYFPYYKDIFIFLFCWLHRYLTVNLWCFWTGKDLEGSISHAHF